MIFLSIIPFLYKFATTMRHMIVSFQSHIQLSSPMNRVINKWPLLSPYVAFSTTMYLVALHDGGSSTKKVTKTREWRKASSHCNRAQIRSWKYFARDYEMPEFSLQDADLSHLDKVNDFLTKHFFTREPLGQKLGISPEKDTQEWLSLVTRPLLKQNVSLKLFLNYGLL